MREMDWRLVVFGLIVGMVWCVEAKSSKGDGYYLELAKRFANESNWKSAAYAFERHSLFCFPSDCFRTLLFASAAHFNAKNPQKAFELANKAVQTDLSSSEACELAESIQLSLPSFHLPDFRQCVKELEPLGEEEWKGMVADANGLWRQQTANSLWLSSLSLPSLQCFLNHTFPIDQYFQNPITHAQVLAYAGYYQLADQMLDYTEQKYKSNYNKAKVSHARMLILMKSDRFEAARLLSTSLPSAFLDSPWLLSDLVYLHHMTGDFSRLRSSLSSLWSKLLHDWLHPTDQPSNQPSNQSKGRKCKRKIVTNWFNDTEVSVSKAIEYGSLQNFKCECLPTDQHHHHHQHQPPPSLASIERNFTYVDKPVHVLSIRNVQLVGDLQMRTDCKRFIGFMVGDDMPKGEGKKEVRVGRVAVTFPLQRNYYHSLIDGASRLAVLIDQLLSDERYDDVMLLMVESEINKEVLQALGVPMERVIAYQPDQFLINASEVFFVDWPHHTRSDLNDRAIQHIAPPAHLLRSLHHWLLDGLFPPHLHDDEEEEQTDGRWQAVYVSRGGAKVRRVRDEEWLIHRLRQTIQSVGGRLTVHTGKGRLIDQARMFRRAKMVIGPHGAGLSNVIFCMHSPIVVELPVINPLWSVFAHLSAALDLEYHVISQLQAPLYGDYQLDSHRLHSLLSSILFFASSLNSTLHS